VKENIINKNTSQFFKTAKRKVRLISSAFFSAYILKSKTACNYAYFAKNAIVKYGRNKFIC
jgi:hypothetical protein